MVKLKVADKHKLKLASLFASCHDWMSRAHKMRIFVEEMHILHLYAFPQKKCTVNHCVNHYTVNRQDPVGL